METLRAHETEHNKTASSARIVIAWTILNFRREIAPSNASEARLSKTHKHFSQSKYRREIEKPMLPSLVRASDPPEPVVARKTRSRCYARPALSEECPLHGRWGGAD